MVYADLHVHTTASDGQLEPAEVPEAAAEAGLGAVAITDHDRLVPTYEAPVTEIDGCTVIRGIELRVETAVERIDLLGYGVEPTPELTEELNRLQRDRIDRAGRMVALIEDRLGIDLAIDLTKGVGRPGIARAVAAHSETPSETYGEVFDGLIGEGDPCYIARDVTGLEQGLALLSDAAGIVSLAHPLRYNDPEAALSLADRLDAIELPYPYNKPVDLAPVERTIEEHDLLMTGGSDAHETEVGTCGLAEAAYDDVRTAID